MEALTPAILAVIIAGQTGIIIWLVTKIYKSEGSTNVCPICKNPECPDPAYCETVLQGYNPVSDLLARDKHDKTDRNLSGQRGNGPSLLDRMCNDMDSMDKHAKKERDEKRHKPHNY